MNDQTNITRIKVVHSALEELSNQVVFVGGATVSLYKDRPASETRVTDDVDIVVEITTYSEFAVIEEKLRNKGFVNDPDSKFMCRYKINGVVVDIMPTNEKILGFVNCWYEEGFKNSISYNIDERIKIRLFDSVHFLASKLEAFNNRGGNDGRMSSDFEDIVYLLNNRGEIWDEINNASPKLNEYLKAEFTKLINSSYIYEWVSAHLDFHEQKREDFIIDGLTSFTLK